jgi:hypothetical protein
LARRKLHRSSPRRKVLGDRDRLSSNIARRVGVAHDEALPDPAIQRLAED